MYSCQNSDQFQKQIIHKIINQKSHLNKIYQKQPLIFSELIKVFNINQSKQSHESLYKLKQRLINICIQQKQDFLGYLYLPKFKQISQHALELIKVSMEQIKQLVKNQQQKLKSDFIFNSLSKLIPQYRSIYDLENYHLQIFQLYSKSSICPNFYQPQYYGENVDDKAKISFEKNVNTFQNSIHSNFVKSRPQDIRQNNPKIMSNLEQKQNLLTKSSKGYYKSQQVIEQQNYMKNYPFQSNSSPLFRKPSKTSKRSSSQLIQDYQPSSGHKMQKVDQSAKIFEDYSQPLSNLSQSKHRTFEVLDPNFKNCLCKGKIQKVGQQQFCCENCMKKFHFQCLRLSNINQKLDRKKCPICTVQQMRNDFFEVIEPPLTSSWIVFNKQNNVPFEIKFNEKLLSQTKNVFKKQKHNVYLKMITILKRSQIDNGIQNGNQRPQYLMKPQNINKEQTQNNQFSSNQNVQYQQAQSNKLDNKTLPNKSKSEHKQNQSSIQLPQRYINEISKSSSPVLSLNFGYSPQYLDKNNNKFYEQERLIYFGIYEVRRRTVEQIIDRYKALFRDQIKILKQEGRFNNQNAIINLITRGQEYKRTNTTNLAQQIAIKFDNVFKKSQKDDKLIYPLRFFKCRELNHIFELQDLYKGFQSDKENNIGENKMNIDYELKYCPKCINQGIKMQQLQSIDIEKNHQRSIYVDYELYQLLNKNSGSQKMIKIDQMKWIKMSVSVRQIQVNYRYSYQTQSMKQPIIEQKFVQQNYANKNNVIGQEKQINEQIQYQQKLNQQQCPAQQSYPIQSSHQSIDYQS